MPDIKKYKLILLLGFTSIGLLISEYSFAEMSYLPSIDKYPENRKAFYEEGGMSSYDLMAGCGFPEGQVKSVPSMPPECAGYFRGIGGLLHSSGNLEGIMFKGQCMDLTSAIPDWTGAAVVSFINHMNKPDADVFHSDALFYIIDSLEKDYPCKEGTPNEIRGRRIMLP